MIQISSRSSDQDSEMASWLQKLLDSLQAILEDNFTLVEGCLTRTMRPDSFGQEVLHRDQAAVSSDFVRW